MSGQPSDVASKIVDLSGLAVQPLNTINSAPEAALTSSVHSKSQRDASPVELVAVADGSEVPSSHVTIRRTLSQLPRELQDQIFTLLSRKEVHTFLFHQATHAAAMNAIWRDIELLDDTAKSNKIDILFFKCLSSYWHHLARTRVFSLHVSSLQE